MAYYLTCPCGLLIKAPDESFVATVQDHLATEHPGLEYTADQIMTFAFPTSD